MPLPPIVTRWQNENERWAARRCAELGIPYEPLWPAVPEAARKAEPEKDEVIRQWAQMNGDERWQWAEVYPELRMIPAAMVDQERSRLNRMCSLELELRICGRILSQPPEASPKKGRQAS